MLSSFFIANPLWLSLQKYKKRGKQSKKCDKNGYPMLFSPSKNEKHPSKSLYPEPYGGSLAKKRYLCLWQNKPM
jgi:hypothetical protein